MSAGYTIVVMKKQKKATSKPIRQSTIILAVIASFAVTIVLYVGLGLFAEYLETAKISDATAIFLIIGGLFAVILGPTLLAALIVLPKIKQNK